MKVYVIEMGEYSDRRIIGVTETEEIAKEMCEKIGGDRWDKATYTEYDTNQFVDRKLRYIVTELCDEWYAKFDSWDLMFTYRENSEVFEDEWVIYANSQEQAIKIAQDMKAEKAAIKEGIV